MHSGLNRYLKKKIPWGASDSEHCASFEINIIFDHIWSVKTLENCEQSH